MDIAEELEAQLYVPPMPEGLSHVWDAWRRVRRRKAAGFKTANPIEWPDIDAFIRTTGEHLDPFDIRMIEALDDTYLASLAAGADEADRQQAVIDGLKRAGR